MEVPPMSKEEQEVRKKRIDASKKIVESNITVEEADQGSGRWCHEC
jgi:competence protein ComGC